MTTKRKTVKVKKINLQRGHVAEIAIPEGHAHIVAHDPERRVVHIAPVLVEKTPEKTGWSWLWDVLFGPDKEEPKS